MFYVSACTAVATDQPSSISKKHFCGSAGSKRRWKDDADADAVRCVGVHFGGGTSGQKGSDCNGR